MKKVVLKTIKVYQKFISPFLPKSCRFYPSCSEYSYLAIEKHGLGKGIIKTVWRLLRCQPYNKGGVDLP